MPWRAAQQARTRLAAALRPPPKQPQRYEQLGVKCLPLAAVGLFTDSTAIVSGLWIAAGLAGRVPCKLKSVRLASGGAKVHTKSWFMSTCNMRWGPCVVLCQVAEGLRLLCDAACTARVSACALQVEAANAEVERSNQARQSDFSGAAERLRKLSTAEYEARGPVTLVWCSKQQNLSVALMHTVAMHLH